MNTQTIANSLVGKTEIEALKTVQNSEMLLRVLERDGLQFVGTRDYNPSRIGVRITNGVITEARVG